MLRPCCLLDSPHRDSWMKVVDSCESTETDGRHRVAINDVVTPVLTPETMMIKVHPKSGKDQKVDRVAA